MLTQYSNTQLRNTQYRDLLPTVFSLGKPYFWGMSSQVEKDGSNYVSKMIDLSGNGNHPIQGTQINKPLWVDAGLNSEPILRFAGSQWLRVQYPTPIYQPITIFIIYSSNAGVAYVVFDGYSNDFYLDIYNNAIIISANTQMFYSKTTPFSYILNSLVYNIGVSKMYENKTFKKEGNVGTNSMDGLTLGAYHTNNYCHSGDIAEILIYDKILSYGLRQNIENYLMIKYAL